MLTGFADFKGTRVALIGQQKGRDTKEKVYRNFGMAAPEGYRKAARLIGLAEKFSLPILSFIDTPGAYPGAEAEERGQAEAIARNLKLMSRCRVPSLSVVIGEGGSGGALGIGVTDKIFMLQYSIYSVISPEACAAILWRDSSFGSQAAKSLKSDAISLKGLGIIDGIIPEPQGGAHKDPKAAAAFIVTTIKKELADLLKTPLPELLENRLHKYASMGKYREKLKTKIKNVHKGKRMGGADKGKQIEGSR